MASISTVEGYLNHFFISMLSQDEFKEQTGIRYLSNRWDNSPYWHVWLTEEPGVFKLELVDVYDETGFDWVANLKVKYYPRENEEVFKQLSVFEQRCRSSEAFHNHPSNSGGCPLHGCAHERHDKFQDLGHESGVPTHEAQTVIPEDFFYAGNILLAYKAEVGTAFSMVSQSTWRVIITEDCEISDEAYDQVIRLHKGELDRDYPGKELTEKLLRRILIGWNLFHRYQYTADYAVVKPGVEFLFDGIEIKQRRTTEVAEYVSEMQLTYSPAVLLHLLKPITGDEASRVERRGECEHCTGY
jgi:hypothetical protein